VTCAVLDALESLRVQQELCNGRIIARRAARNCWLRSGLPRNGAMGTWPCAVKEVAILRQRVEFDRRV
jgi:hypothetical protein